MRFRDGFECRLGDIYMDKEQLKTSIDSSTYSLVSSSVSAVGSLIQRELRREPSGWLPRSR
jgi:hypothetical protein